jgi:hypothetical protein
MKGLSAKGVQGLGRYRRKSGNLGFESGTVDVVAK